MDVVYALKRQGRTLYGFGGYPFEPAAAAADHTSGGRRRPIPFTPGFF